MDQLITAFGIDWRILIAQVIVFAILYFAFHKLALKPILDFVQERTKKIEDGVKNAREATKALEEAKAEQELTLTQARKEAQAIIAAAREQAEVAATADRQKAAEEIEANLERAKKQIEEQKEQVLREAQSQAVELVMAATTKLLEDKVDVAADNAYVEKIVQEVSK